MLEKTQELIIGTYDSSGVPESQEKTTIMNVIKICFNSLQQNMQIVFRPTVFTKRTITRIPRQPLTSHVKLFKLSIYHGALHKLLRLISIRGAYNPQTPRPHCWAFMNYEWRPNLECFNVRWEDFITKLGRKLVDVKTQLHDATDAIQLWIFR